MPVKNSNKENKRHLKGSFKDFCFKAGTSDLTCNMPGSVGTNELRAQCSSESKVF